MSTSQATTRIPATETVNGTRIKCYDDGGKHFDRYSVLFVDQPCGYPVMDEPWNSVECLAMSEHPSAPNGFCQHTTAVAGRHLGKRIRFADLPEDCQAAVRYDTTPEA